MSNFQKIADSAKNFACELYRAQPGALIPTPFSDLLHQVWDGFCGDPPRDPANLPPPATSPFQGGQCCDSYYDVYGVVNYFNVPNPGQERQFGEYLLGKIDGIVSNISPDGASRQFQLKYTRCNGSSIYKNVLSVSIDDPLADAQITRVVLVSGKDDCGNPPKEYPPGQVPPGGFTSPPTPITFNDNTTNNYIFNFTPPAAPAKPALAPPPIVINYFNASFNPDFKIPISFNFNGTINFGGGGTDYNQDDRDKINNINNTTNNTNNSVSNINNTTSQTKTDINNFINIVNNQPPKPEDFNPPKPAVLPGTYAESYLAAVEVTLTSYPKNIRSQEGGNAPDVLYAGWFEFMREGKALPRQPIHFEKAVFVAPTGVDGYAYTLYTGVQGTAVAITKKEKI